MKIKEILESGDPVAIKSLFAFGKSDSVEHVFVKLNLWMRHFFPQYFSSKDAPFHREIDLNNIKVYRGDLLQFVNGAFKGAAKTSRTKLFVAFAIANDSDHFRRYFRVLSADSTNSVQISTDVYNMLVKPDVAAMYPEIFAKTEAKREETMSSFTTTTGIKIYADTVGVSQRGALQEEARPDFVWFEDFENRKTLRSAKTTKAIWDNMEEARTGLAKGGGCLYTCNYISEMGNVHTLIKKESAGKVVLITPIMRDGVPTWERYSVADIEQMKIDDDDFEGERMCRPSAAKDIIFDRENLDAMVPLEPAKIIADFKIFKPFDASHLYGRGHDVAGGVGLDSSTSVNIDFSLIPARVVATFKSNTIRPDTFGDEINREGDYFDNPITGIEKNNHGHATIARARQLGVNLYRTQRAADRVGNPTPTEYGWHTNAGTKPTMIFALVKAVNDGLLELSDPDLIQECKDYTRNDLIDDVKDPRLTTRHFDLLIACAIAWQMKGFCDIKPRNDIQILDDELDMLYPQIGM